jgi:DNA modification methylase
MGSQTWQILAGDCRASLAALPAGSVQTCVTSPPYFGLRDYGHDGQIGLEPTPGRVRGRPRGGVP